MNFVSEIAGNRRSLPSSGSKEHSHTHVAISPLVLFLLFQLEVRTNSYSLLYRLLRLAFHVSGGAVGSVFVFCSDHREFDLFRWFAVLPRLFLLVSDFSVVLGPLCRHDDVSR